MLERPGVHGMVKNIKKQYLIYYIDHPRYHDVQCRCSVTNTIYARHCIGCMADQACHPTLALSMLWCGRLDYWHYDY